MTTFYTLECLIAFHVSLIIFGENFPERRLFLQNKHLIKKSMEKLDIYYQDAYSPLSSDYVGTLHYMIVSSDINFTYLRTYLIYTDKYVDLHVS